MTKLARNPPTFTMPFAPPSARIGLKVRAKSNPMSEPGPPTPTTTNRTITSHIGGTPGQRRSAAQATPMTVTIPSTRLLRR